jgi:uncharacterized protein YkwD
LKLQAQPSPPPSQAQPLQAQLSGLRMRGCGGHAPATAPLHTIERLDQAARLLAQGQPLSQALQAAGYRTVRASEISLTGYTQGEAVIQAMADQYCELLADEQLTDIGVWRRGSAWWLILAEPFKPPPEAAASEVSARILALTNRARSQARRCGDRIFEAAEPLALNEALTRAAAQHANDMARHGFLSHQGRDGSDPAVRASRAGYGWRRIGENIAAGQATPEKVVADWLASAKHCENLMTPAYTEMGVAYAVNDSSPDGIYWAQSLAQPR